MSVVDVSSLHREYLFDFLRTGTARTNASKCRLCGWECLEKQLRIIKVLQVRMYKNNVSLRSDRQP